MQPLTSEGQRVVGDVAQRHGFSEDAVTHMLYAVAAGNGSQAQFNHWEFGGMGQWSMGGMLMIGDMFNDNLKGRVSSLCQELSGLVQSQPMFSAPAQSQTQSQSPGGYSGQMQGGGMQMQGGGFASQSQGGNGGGAGTSLFVSGGAGGGANWWPADLGQAGSVGAQNNLRYAYFPNARRLAIDVGGAVTVYDTLDHNIGGFSQQQSGDQSLTFNSQYGVVPVSSLPVISGAAPMTGSGQAHAEAALAGLAPVSNEVTSTEEAAFQPATQPQPQPVEMPASPNMQGGGRSGLAGNTPDEIFATLERLAGLRDNGIVSEDEFQTKKAELLARL